MAGTTRALALIALCGASAMSGLACTPGRSQAHPSALPAAAGAGHRLLDLPAASNLPADVEVFVGISPVERLAEQLDWDSLRGRHPDLWGRWASRIQAKLGRSILDVGDLSQLGVATDRPFGVALLDTERTIACLFAEVRDEASLDAWLRQLARHHKVDIRVETEGLATIAWTPALPEVLLVRRGGHLFVVFGDAEPSRLHEQARRVALVSAERSLASETAFRAMGREVGRGAMVAAYVRSAALAQKRLGIWDRQVDPIFGSFSGAAMGVWSAGDHLRLEGFIALRPDSLVNRGLGAPRGVSELHGLRARSLVVTATLHRELLGELLRAGYAATGDPTRARAALSDRLQLDLEQKVIGHLDGTLALLASRSSPDMPPSLTTSVAASLLPGHDVASIIEAWQGGAAAPALPAESALAPYGLSKRVVWSHGSSPLAADETSIRGDEPLDRALLTLRHRPTVLAMTADLAVWPVLSSPLPSPTWEALCEPLGVLGIRADRDEGGLTLRGALFLRETNLAAYAERAMRRLER